MIAVSVDRAVLIYLQRPLNTGQVTVNRKTLFDSASFRLRQITPEQDRFARFLLGRLGSL